MAASRLSFGILLPTRGVLLKGEEVPDPSPIFRLAELAEEMGYDSLWVGDSLIAKPRLEAMTTLAAVAARTSRAKIGTAVLLSAMRQPVLLAHAVATIDVISGGRFLLGIGVGVGGHPIFEKEFQVSGVPFKERARRLEEGLTLMKELWSRSPVTFRGKYYQVEDVSLEPKPIQKPHPPVWIASGVVESGLKRVAVYGDAWTTTIAEPRDYAASLEKIKRFAKEAGRDPDSIHPSIYMTVNLSGDGTAAREEGAGFVTNYYHMPFDVLSKLLVCRFGTPKEVTAWLKEYIEAGACSMCVRFAAADQVGQLKLFTNEVLPKLQ